MPDYHNGNSASKIERTFIHEFALVDLFKWPRKTDTAFVTPTDIP